MLEAIAGSPSLPPSLHYLLFVLPSALLCSALSLSLSLSLYCSLLDLSSLRVSTLGKLCTSFDAHVYPFLSTRAARHRSLDNFWPSLLLCSCLLSSLLFWVLDRQLRFTSLHFTEFVQLLFSSAGSRLGPGAVLALECSNAWSHAPHVPCPLSGPCKRERRANEEEERESEKVCERATLVAALDSASSASPLLMPLWVWRGLSAPPFLVAQHIQSCNT
ncbi:hypothetical protein Mapa_004314 [Marchantia paleacea]|nr:hypothetical protein Mapa_004314 [Marchantia paleacea]